MISAQNSKHYMRSLLEASGVPVISQGLQAWVRRELLETSRAVAFSQGLRDWIRCEIVDDDPYDGADAEVRTYAVEVDPVSVRSSQFPGLDGDR
jgi:hypothetical protein